MAFDPTKVDLGSLSQVAAGDELGGFDTGEDNLNFTMSEAIKIDPGQHAKNLDLSKESGIPVFAVESDPAAIEQDIKKSQFDFTGMQDANPATAGHLQNLDNAVVSQNDVDVLKGIEDTLGYAGDVVVAGTAGAFTGTLGLSESIFRTPDAIRRWSRGLSESLEDTTGLPRALNPIRAVESIADFLGAGQIPGTDIRTGGGTDVAGRIGETQQVLSEEFEPFKANLESAKRADTAFVAAMGGDLSGVIDISTDPVAMSGFLGQAVPSLVTAYASGGSIPFMAWMESMEVASNAADFEARTGEKIDDVEFMQAQAQVGIVNSILEKFVPDALLKGEAGNSFLSVLGTGVKEFATEMTQAANTNLAEKITFDPEKELTEGVLASGLGGFGAGVVTSGTQYAVGKIARDENVKDTKGAIEQDKLDKLNEMATQSETNNLNKEAFRQFVEQADGDSNTNVFIDGVQTSLYLQDKTAEEIEADPALKLLSEQAREAAALGVDVQVPVADFAADIAGTDHFTALRDSMTMSDETTSPFRQEQAQQETETYVRVLMDEAQESASEYVEAQEIYSTVRDQLIDSGQVNAANASVMAQVVPAWATAQARRSGKTVQQVYEDSGLIIEGPQTGERARLEGEQVLEQRGVTTADLQSSLQAEEVDVQLRGEGDIVTLDKIAVLEGQRETGVGTAAMQRIIDWADANGKTIALSPSKDFGGTVSRLKKFYKGLGFVENKGRNKDLEISETMFYTPKDTTPLAQPVIPTGIEVEEITDAAEQQRILEEFAALRPGGLQAEQKPYRTVSGRKIDESWREATRILRNGNPALLYRGSRSGLDSSKFEKEALGQNTKNPMSGLGVFLTSDVEEAGRYGPVVEPFHLDVRKFKRYTEDDSPEFDSLDDAYNFREGLRTEGYDGIIFDYRGVEGPVNFVVFEPDQVIHPAETADAQKFFQPQIGLKDIPDSRIDVYRYLVEFDGRTASELIDIAASVANQHDELYTDTTPEVFTDEVLSKAMTAIAENGAKEIPLIYSKSPDKSATFWDEKGNTYLATKSSVIQRSNEEGESKGDLSDADGMTLNILSRVFKEIREQDPAIQEQQRVEGLKRTEVNRRQRRLQDIPVMPADFDRALQTLADWAENLEEFKEALNPGMFDISDRNLTRLGRATMALEPDEYETAGRGDVTIYRALPSGEEIEAGDWVSFSEDYASGHETNVGEEGGETIAAEVPGEDVYWFGADENEWVYIPDNTWAVESIDELWANLTDGAKPLTYPTVEGLRVFQRDDKQPDARGYYDPANSIIRLTEAADLSTFLHEFAHFMYEMEVNGDTEMLQSINNWYKRNAEDVAREANSYLGDKFDALKQGGVAHRYKLGDLPRDMREELFNEHAMNLNPEATERGFYAKRVPSGSINIEELIIADIPESQIQYHLEVEPKDLPPIVISDGRLIDGQHRIAAARSVGVETLRFIDVTGLIDTDAGGFISELPADPDMFAQPTTPPTAKEGSIIEDDVVTYLDNKTTGDKDKDNAIRRAVHEQFARGFETYLMEGKAPSVELRNAFRTFARWLSRIYQGLRGQLNVNIDKEMREVFDRLLATEDQIAAAEARTRVAPMFTDAAMVGMTEGEFTKYQKQQEKVKDVQSETLRDKIIKHLTRQTKAWWKEEKQDIIDEEVDTLKGERVYASRERLRTGDIKLDHATVKEMAGEEKTNKLGRTSIVIPPKLVGTTAKGMKGIHPDEAAAFFGYGSGSEMLNDLATAPNIKVQSEVNAEARMVERHGDILTDGTIEREADEAVQNEERGKLILSELKALAKGTNAPTIDRATIKAVAEANIGKLSFREIHPGKYRKAEIRAAQESARMLAEGNKEGAAAAKMRQVMNYYLGMAATDAKNDTTKIIDNMSRYNKKKVREEIMKAEGGYWDQITRILDRFEFRKSATLKEVESLNTWVKERMETDGDGLVLSNAVLNESYVTHWKNVPFSDLQGINDSVKNIEHVARYANKIKLADEEIEFKKLKNQWVDHIKQQDQRFDTKASRSRLDDSRKATTMEHIRKWASQLTKVPFLASWLDGGERAGFSHDILVQQFTDALDAKMRLMDEVFTPVVALIRGRDKADRKRHNTKVWIPEIDDHLEGHQIVAVALNTGNQGNLKKLLLGEGWADPENEADISFDNPKLQAVLAHMTKSDWEMVQKIWDQMDALYPQLAEVHRRTTGLTPPKVEATPVATKFGVFKGGYYPVKYSPKRSHKAEKNAEKREAETESMFNNTASIQSSVNTGSTNERTGFYDRIYLSLEVVPDHFNETIHYITHHDAVRQVNRLIQSPDVADAITGVLGEEEFKQLKPWLNDVAKDGRQQPVKTYIDESFHRLRFGTTLGVMGFKASTGIMQLFGILTTAAELGVGPTVKGVQTTIGRSWYMKAVRNLLGSRDDMQTGWEFAVERSKVMAHRTDTMDREIRNAMDRLRGKTGFIAATQEVSMKHIALIQTYMVDLPTWHAAYDKELSESGDEAKAVKRADWSVENLQGSGATKDMATIVRSQSKIHTTFTMFMTFFSSLGNLSVDLAKGSKSGLYSPTSVAAKAMFLYSLPVFLEMLMCGDLDEPEDEDDRMSKLLTGVALYPLASVPFVRDVAGGLIGEYGYNVSPVSSVIEKGISGFKQIGERVLTDDEITKGAAKGASKLAAAAAGIPGVNQAWSTGEHLYDVIEEGEDFTVRELIFGPKRD